MTAFHPCLASIFLMLLSMSCTATDLRPHGPRVQLWYLLQMTEGRTVTPMDGEEGLLKAVARDQARMYISGVIDTGESRQWCIYLSNLPPHEVFDELLKSLRALPSSAKDRNSALAIGDFLKSRFPCRK